MDQLVMLMIGGIAVAFLMNCSTYWWKAHLKENESHQVLECDIGITPDEIGEFPVYDATPGFYAIFSTLIAVILFTITSFEAIFQFIPGWLLKLVVWTLGTAIIILLPIFLAKRGNKKGR